VRLCAIPRCRTAMPARSLGHIGLLYERSRLRVVERLVQNYWNEQPAMDSDPEVAPRVGSHGSSAEELAGLRAGRRTKGRAVNDSKCMRIARRARSRDDRAGQCVGEVRFDKRLPSDAVRGMQRVWETVTEDKEGDTGHLAAGAEVAGRRCAALEARYRRSRN